MRTRTVVIRMLAAISEGHASVTVLNKDSQDDDVQITCWQLEIFVLHVGAAMLHIVSRSNTERK